MKKFERLDAVRGLVAIYVIIHHLFAFVPGAVEKFTFGFLDLSIIFHRGGNGVIIFFALSGIVIQYSFFYAKDKSFKTYFFKRFTRIFIPLFAVWIVYPLVKYYENGFVGGFGFATLIGNLLMLQDVGGYQTNSFYPLFGNYPTWSLSYEWWYYMFFFLMMRIKKVNIMYYIVYAIIITSTIFSEIFSNIVVRFGAFFMFWWIGREIARLYIEKKDINIKNLALPLGCILFGGIVHYYKDSLGIFLEIGRSILCFEMLTIIIIGIYWRKIGWLFFNYIIGPFKILAPISYTLYISHTLLITEARYLNFIPNWYIRYFLYFMVCIGFSYLVERIVYPKVLKWLKSIFFKPALN